MRQAVSFGIIIFTLFVGVGIGLAVGGVGLPGMSPSKGRPVATPRPTRTTVPAPTAVAFPFRTPTAPGTSTPAPSPTRAILTPVLPPAQTATRHLAGLTATPTKPTTPLTSPTAAQTPSPPAPSPTRPTTPTAGQPQPNIEMTAPTEGQRIRSPVRVTGRARVFEGNVLVVVKDRNGVVLVQTPVQASVGAPGWGTFDAQVGFRSPGSEQPGSVEVFSPNRQDGSPENTVTVKVVLTP